MSVQPFFWLSSDWEAMPLGELATHVAVYPREGNRHGFLNTPHGSVITIPWAGQFLLRGLEYRYSLQVFTSGFLFRCLKK